MQAIKLEPISLIIPGGYWDTQIYSGELTLFRDDGALTRLQWRTVIDEIADANPQMQTGLRVAFRDGDMFYNESVRKILLDPQIAEPIKLQLYAAAGQQFSLDHQRLEKKSVVKTSPIHFVPSDTETYYHTLFVAGEEGLFSVHRSMDGYTSRRHHEAPTFQVKASFDTTTLASAAGDDGLFEFPILGTEAQRVPGAGTQVSKRFCTACDWAFQSIVGWSTEAAFLANFTEERDSRTARRFRAKSGIYDLGEVFSAVDALEEGSTAFVWGSREKIYRLSSEFVDVLDYDHKSARKPVRDSKDAIAKPTPDDGKQYFDSRGRVGAGDDADPDDVVAVGTAPFGTIVEFDDRLLVMGSDGRRHTYQGEIVHWRVFPRSDHYSNQLHIVYEDRVEIVSFVHDYFVNQSKKLIGFSRSVRDEIVW
jgi:hypothetical protein